MATQVQPLPVDALSQQAERRRMADSALGTTLAEGVSPGPEVLALTERYVAGEISLAELGAMVRGMSGL